MFFNKLFAFLLIFIPFIPAYKGELQNVTVSAKNKTDFKFLVKSGYRPETHTLNKYIVSIRHIYGEYFGDDHQCGGSIYNETSIITAAHCVMDEKNQPTDPAELFVVAGVINRLEYTKTTQVMHIKEIVIHPKYDRINKYDICLIILDSDLKLDGKTAAKVELADQKYSAGTNCVVFGWGMLFWDGPLPAELVYANLSLLSDKKCRAHSKYVADGMICAQNPDDFDVNTSNGDSGGPLMCNNQLVGVVSWGSAGRKSNVPSVYSDVFYFRDWIIRGELNAGSISSIEIYKSWLYFCINFFLLSPTM